MKFTEIQKNLFEVSNDYHLAHCISSDCAMGAGIAVEFQRRFKIRETLLAMPESDRKYPTCIKVKRVFNLITKKNYWNKPTCDSLRGSLLKMKEIALSEGVKKIAMPRIGSGLDRLSWSRVKEIVMDVFYDTDIEILVCSI